MLDDSETPSTVEPQEPPLLPSLFSAPPSSSFSNPDLTRSSSFNFRATLPIRRSGRLAKRSHSVVGTHDIRDFRVAKRGRSSEAPENERSKVRVVEPLLVQELKNELSAKIDVIHGLERTIRSGDDDRTRAAFLNRQLKEQVETLQKRQAELEETNTETLNILENLKNTHRLEIEAHQANFIEEMSVKTSLDPSTAVENNAVYKALEAKYQSMSQSLATTERRLNEVEETLLARNAELREHRSHRDRLLEQQSVLEVELANSRSTEKASNKSRRETVAQLDTQIKEHQETKEDLRLANENLTNLLRSLHTTEQNLRLCQQAEEQYKANIDGLNRVIETKDSELARMVSLKDSLQEKVESFSRLLEQEKIALQAQERRQGDLEATRRELALANVRVSELSQQLDDSQHSTNNIQNNHRSELQTLNERLSESKSRVDDIMRQMQAQRREMLAEKNQALEVEREEINVKDRLLRETRTTADQTREENQRLQERIDVLELENKRLGKARADGPADTETMNVLGITRKRNNKPQTIFSMMTSQMQEPNVAREETPGSDSEHSDLGRQRPSSNPAFTETKLASPFRQTPQSRQSSPEIAAPGTYRAITNPKRTAQGTSSSHLATPVGRTQDRQSLSPGPSSSGPSRIQNSTLDLSSMVTLPPSHSPESSRSPSPSLRKRSQGRRYDAERSDSYAPSGLRGSTSRPYSDSMDHDIAESPARMGELLMQTLLKFAQSSKKPRYMVSPFKSEATPRPRTPQKNKMMAASRALLFQLLEISSDAQMSRIDRSHCVSLTDSEVEGFENGDPRKAPNLDPPLKICWDNLKCKWNMYLAKLFAIRLVRLEPSLKGQQDEISEHFMQRIQTLKAAFCKGLPREGETLQHSRDRLSREHQKALHEKRIRRRQIELKDRRINDCNTAGTSEDKELADMVQLLGDDGVSSDESDGRGNRLVRDKYWRNRAIINRMARADSKHRTTGIYGNRRPGAQLQRRIRRKHGPVSEKKIPEGKPINYYDTAVYHSLSPEERIQLGAQPRVPFRGEYDPVDESLFD